MQTTDLQRGIKFTSQDVIVQDLLPPLVHRSLSVPNEPDPFLHQRTDVDVVREAGVSGNDTDTAALLHAREHLVDDFWHVRLQHQSLLHLVQQGLRLMERTTVECDVESSRADLLETLHDIRMDREVKGFDARLLLGKGETFRNSVNTDDTLRALEFGEFRHALADGAQTLRQTASDKCVHIPLVLSHTHMPTVSPS